MFNYNHVYNVFVWLFNFFIYHHTEHQVTAHMVTACTRYFTHVLEYFNVIVFHAFF